MTAGRRRSANNAVQKINMHNDVKDLANNNTQNDNPPATKLNFIILLYPNRSVRLPPSIEETNDPIPNHMPI